MSRALTCCCVQAVRQRSRRLHARRGRQAVDAHHPPDMGSGLPQVDQKATAQDFSCRVVLDKVFCYCKGSEGSTFDKSTSGAKRVGYRYKY